MADATIRLEFLPLEGGNTFLIPSEDDIARALWESEKAESEGKPELAQAFQKRVADLKGKRERFIGHPNVQVLTVEIAKPSFGDLQQAKLRHSTINPVTGIPSVNPIGMMKDLLPQCVVGGTANIPTDPTLAQVIEDRLYSLLYPSQEQLDFLLSRL